MPSAPRAVQAAGDLPQGQPAWALAFHYEDIAPRMSAGNTWSTCQRGLRTSRFKLTFQPVGLS